MAGINLVRKLKQSREGGGDAPKKSLFSGISMPSFGGGGGGSSGESISMGDKVRILLMLAGIAAIPLARDQVREYTAKIEVEKRAEIQSFDQQIAAESSKLNQLKGLASEADAYEKQMQELSRKLAMIEALGKNRNLAVRMVDFVVSEMPSNLWLTKMNLDVKQDQKIEVAGNATTMQTVSDFLKRLEGAVFFPAWQLVETAKVDGGGAGAGGGAFSSGQSNARSSQVVIPTDTKSFQVNARVVPL